MIAEPEIYQTKNTQLDQTLQQKEASFFKLFTTSPNPMAITTIKEGRIIDFNEAFARFVGYQREEVIGKTTMEHGIWTDLEQRNNVVAKLLKEGNARNLELRLNTKNRGLDTVLFHVFTVSLGSEPYLLGIAIDITDRKNAEAQLRESEEKYRLLVENSLQGLAIMQDSSFVFCNSRLAEISGYSIEELLSLSGEEMTAMVHKDDRAFIEKHRFDRMAGVPVPTRYEYRGIRKDGTVIWLEICSSFIEYNGKPAIQSALMDITERKKTAESLNKALDWQKAIFEGSRDAIMISDINCKFVDANEATCRLTGYSREELLNMEAWDLNNSVDPTVLDTLRNRILNGEDIVGETKIITKSGYEVEVEFGHRSVNISGKPYLHSIARDITKRKSLEAQFLQAQKMEAVGVLAGGMAHDLNNMLNVINGYSELILEDFAQDHPMRPDLEQIQKAGKQAASLISQLLAFSRKQILQPEILSLNQIIAEMSAMLRRLLGEIIKLETSMSPEVGLLSADPVQIQQIIMNIVINARDAMPEGGKLTIETANIDFENDYIGEHPVAKAGTYVMLSISDNGVGMDAATQAHLFEPFFTTKEKGKGTGLGLSTVYGIVKQSNGFIWIYSKPGKGTTVQIYLPRVEGEIAEAAAEGKLEHRDRGFGTVLVAEDEASVRAFACRILRERGYTVLEASDGKEALDIAQRHKEDIQLILTDVVMPVMGGKDLVSQLKAIRPGIKVLYVSGYTDNAIVHHSILDSDVAFLQKPFTVESLARKVREVIDS